MKRNGGCLCGDIRYEADLHDGDVADYCHCSQCRRASGAPVVAWIQVPPERFRVTTGSAKGFSSSPEATRWFCARCGSPLYMSDPNGHSIGINIATLDAAAEVAPNGHGWFSARLPWFDTRDDLERHGETPPYDL